VDLELIQKRRRRKKRRERCGRKGVLFGNVKPFFIIIYLFI